MYLKYISRPFVFETRSYYLFAWDDLKLKILLLPSPE
jgi:hypothetical protein